MVDEVRVSRLLRAARDDLASLQREARSPADRRADPLWLSGVKYLFITAIEACVDVAQHICASEGWGPPSTNAESLRVLAQHGVIDSALAPRMGRAVGFRNVLVHDYVDVDDAVVLARLADVSDLDDFTRAVGGWLASGAGSGGQ